MASELKLTNIKHPSSGSNNLVLGSDGNVSITNTLSAGSMGAFDRTYIATKIYLGKSARTYAGYGSGTWHTGATSHTLNNSTTYCIIQLFGGGGQGSATSNVYYGAAGGGSGAYAKFLLDVTDSNFASDNGNATTLYFELARGVYTGSSVDGESSHFKVSSTAIITCTGGAKGAGHTGGAGGTVSVWTNKSYTKKIMLSSGLPGEDGVGGSGSGVTTSAGNGAPNPLGFGGNPMTLQVNTEGPGKDATGLGGGGMGGQRHGGGYEKSGGIGYNGGIIIEEYS